MSDGEQIENSELGRGRPRFSLLTLLLVTTIAALGVTVWQLGREVVPLREEIRRLRDEVGDLVVEDKSKFCAIRARTDEYLTWKWRLWIPPGQTYVLKYKSGKISEKAFDTYSASGTMYFEESGEYWVAYRIRKDPRDGRWYGNLSREGGAMGKDLHEWVEWQNVATSTRGVGYKTISREVVSPFTLIRHLVRNSDEADEYEFPSPGFEIWIEPRESDAEE